MTPLFQLWGCGMKVWQMQMWERGRVVSAGWAPRGPELGVRCRMDGAAQPPSPLQNKPLPQPQESGAWGRVPPGHELLQNCWCHCFYMIFFFLIPIFFFFYFPSCFSSTHTWRGRMQAHACCIFPCAAENIYIFFFPYRYIEECMISIWCSKKEHFLFFFLVC